MSEQIVRADPQLRRSVAKWAVLGMIGFGGLFSWIAIRLGGIEELAAVDGQAAIEQLRSAARWAAGSIVVVGLPFGAWFAWFGIRVLRHAQFPPPKMRVLKDMRILRGSPARWRGGIALVLGLGMLAGTAYAYLLILAILSQLR